MRIIQIKCEQAHWFPPSPRPARGPFTPELLAKALPVIDTPDDGHDCPPGWTAQSPTGPAPTLYQCTYCDVILAEDQLDGHVCA